MDVTITLSTKEIAGAISALAFSAYMLEQLNNTDEQTGKEQERRKELMGIISKLTEQSTAHYAKHTTCTNKAEQGTQLA